ncbi:MAG: hypothetical protein CSYNP_04355 [Syntrophus sp. SKADARSKE-3]|nr:hypothetical protein [Syntrophus sp. SKADARSKE-3]
MPIEPGLPVYIVHDQIVKNADLLKATVYGIRGKRIILSQTRPALPASFVGKSVIVSFLDSTGDSAKRWGCLGVIADIVDAFELAPGRQEPAVVVTRKKEPEPVTLRRSNRVRPPGDGSLELLVQDSQYVIFDISLHGINFIQPKEEEAFPVSSIVELTLEIDEKPYKLSAKVVRVAEKDDGRYNSLDFSGISGEVEETLGIKLFSVEMLTMRLDAF